MAEKLRIYHTDEKGFHEWKNYYSRLLQKGIYHSPEYIKLLEEHYQNEAELFVFGDDENFVYYPYIKQCLSDLLFLKEDQINVKGYYDIVSSWYYGGPLIKAEKTQERLFHDFFDAFNDYAAKNGIITEFIRFDANLRNYELYPPGYALFDRETVYVHLTQTLQAIWADFSTANRRAIRKAMQNGFQVHETDITDETRWTKFFDIYQSEMRRKNAPKHLVFPISFFFKLKEELSGASILLTIERDGVCCGGFIIVFEGEFAFHFLSATSPEYWPERVNNLLFYHAILWAKENGYSVFDFMGGREGVFKFKSNFSSSRNKLYVAKVVHNQDLFEKLSHGVETDRLSFFPSYRFYMR